MIRALFLTISLLFSFEALAQSGVGNSALAKYTGENGRLFLEPLMDGAALNLQTGYAYQAHIPKKAFRVTLGIHSMLGLVSEKQGTYTATTDGFFTPQQNVQTATILGSTEGARATGDGGTVYQFPGGLGLAYLPLGAAQAGISGVFGSEVFVRYFAASPQEFFRTRMAGFGIRHCLSQYFGAHPPVDISVGYFFTSFRLRILDQTNNNLDFKSGQFQVMLGKRFGVFHVYGGGGYQHGAAVAAFFDPDNLFAFSNSYLSQNFVRFVGGAGLDIHPFFISTDINLGGNMPIWHTTAGFNIGKRDPRLPK